MKLLSIFVACLLTCSLSNITPTAFAHEEEKIDKLDIIKILDMTNRPYLLKTFNSSNPLSKSTSASKYTVVLLCRLENSIGLDEAGKVNSFVIMDCESWIAGNIVFNQSENRDLIVKVHPNGAFTAFRTNRTVSASPESTFNKWEPYGEEIDLSNIKTLPKWLQHRVPLLEKALIEAQNTVDYRKEYKDKLEAK